MPPVADLPPKLWIPQRPAIIRPAHDLMRSAGKIAMPGLLGAVQVLNGGIGNDGFTKSLLHFDGTNGSTTFTDSAAGGSHTWTAHGATISTAQSKFGGASGVFNGTSAYLDTPDSADFKFGNGDFTIDLWIYLTGASAGYQIYGKRAGSSSNSVCIYGDASNINLYASSNGSSWDIASGVAIGTVSINSWHHYAVSRSGNTWRTFKDGTQTNSFSSSATIMDDTSNVVLGAENGGTGSFTAGYFDEFRVSKGIARYTAAFTPASAAYG